MKSLAIIANEASALETALLESGGEITPEIEKLLQVNQDELSQKVDGYSVVLERLKKAKEFYEDRAEMFQKAAVTMESTAKRLKENIKFAMKTMGVTVLSGDDVRFQLNKAAPVLKIDAEKEDELKRLYPKVTTTTEIDKEKLKADLAIGPVEGAELEPNVSFNTYSALPKELPNKSSKAKKGA